jgi:tripartite-type tricarboxylate transporter receptor subunit TctC
MTLRFAAALAAGLMLAPGAQAQTYPSKTVTLVVPFPAGGSTDWLSRLLGQKLEQRLKQPVIVENRAGGANVIAATAVAKAEPDGHTLLMTTSTTMAINASTGPGSAANLYAVLLKNALGGIAMTPIPYKGNAPGLQDVVAGHVSVMFSDLLSALPLIETGKLRALGVSTGKRSAAAPDIPTLAEAGVAGYDASAWQMIVAPAKTPATIVDKLNAELNAIVSEGATNRGINARGHIAIATPPPAELKTFVRSEIARWAKVVDEAGARGTE